MPSDQSQHIAELAALLDEPLQNRLWEYAQLLYVEQVAFREDDDSIADAGPHPLHTVHLLQR